MIRGLVAGMLILHGLIHGMGFVKGYELASLPQLQEPVSRGMGLVWLQAGLLFIGAAAALWVWPRGWWILGGIALVMSQFAIVQSWADAKFGTVLNVISLVAVIQGCAVEGPWGFRAAFRRDVHASVAWEAPLVLSEEDLVPLPEVVQRYVRSSGWVGRPRVLNFCATWRGRIRSANNSSWMPFVAEQFNSLEMPRRFFRMDARMKGMPVEVYHAFRESGATMQVRLLSLFPLANAKGPDLTRAETVTLFNDLCFFAPGELVSPRITWGPSDTRSAHAKFTLGSNSINAELRFNDRDELIDFLTDDRLKSAPDGKSFKPMHWTTPVKDYVRIGQVRLPTKASVLWHPASDSFTYGEFDLAGISYNQGPRP